MSIKYTNFRLTTDTDSAKSFDLKKSFKDITKQLHENAATTTRRRTSSSGGYFSPWRKNLYDNTEYEDNYTDPSFLKDLRTNLNVRFFTFGEAFCGITLLNNQISCIAAFLIIFNLLYTERISPTDVLLPSGVITSIGYIIYRGRSLRMSQLIEDSKTLLTVLVFGYLFAPLLHTLTAAISTDTIFALTFVVMVLNLVFFDYGLTVAMVSKAISLNAAIFGAICLASRLPTSYHAFVLLVEAAAFFVLSPIFTAVYWRAYFLLPMFIACCYNLYKISKVVLYTYVTVTLFINLVCPWAFVVLQRHKQNIHGPWDEAIVEESTDSNLDEKL